MLKLEELRIIIQTAIRLIKFTLLLNCTLTWKYLTVLIVLEYSILWTSIALILKELPRRLLMILIYRHIGFSVNKIICGFTQVHTIHKHTLLISFLWARNAIAIITIMCRRHIHSVLQISLSCDANAITFICIWRLR